METKVYNQKGKEDGKIALPESVFGLPWNADLVHEVVTSLLNSRRTPVAHTKDRSEVSGTGKKPWQQKGTGRARHGSRRSPIWVGGGIAHGPRNEKNFDRKVNKKVKAKAFATVLSAKFKDGEIIFLDSLSFDAPKTKTAKEILSLFEKDFKGIASKKKNSAVLALSSSEKNTEKSFANIGNISVAKTKDLSILDILNAKYLVLENATEAVKILTDRVVKN